jgi:hypothetical protein
MRKNDEALMSNNEGMMKNSHDSLSRYTATSYLRFDDLTIQRFNMAKPFVIRHFNHAC